MRVDLSNVCTHACIGLGKQQVVLATSEVCGLYVAAHERRRSGVQRNWDLFLTCAHVC